MNSPRSELQAIKIDHVKEDRLLKSLCDRVNATLRKTPGVKLDVSIGAGRFVDKSTSMTPEKTFEGHGLEANAVATESIGATSNRVKLPWSSLFVKALEEAQLAGVNNDGPFFNFVNIRKSLSVPLSTRRQWSQVGLAGDMDDVNEFNVTRRQMKIFDLVDIHHFDINTSFEIRTCIEEIYGYKFGADPSIDGT